MSLELPCRVIPTRYLTLSAGIADPLDRPEGWNLKCQGKGWTARHRPCQHCCGSRAALRMLTMRVRHRRYWSVTEDSQKEYFSNLSPTRQMDSPSRPRRRARCLPARPTSSVPTAWSKPLRPKKACSWISSTKPLPGWNPGWSAIVRKRERFLGLLPVHATDLIPVGRVLSAGRSKTRWPCIGCKHGERNDGTENRG